MRIVSINYKDEDCVKALKNGIIGLLDSNNKNIVIICIGTDRCTGDSLGPLVGTLIKDNIHVPVFGTLENTVNATNISEVLDYVNDKYMNPFIIAIDACIGSEVADVGNINIRNSSLKPGSALDKVLPKIGNISILGIVNYDYGYGFTLKSLSNTRLNTVYKISQQISKSLIEIFEEINKEVILNS